MNFLAVVQQILLFIHLVKKRYQKKSSDRKSFVQPGVLMDKHWLSERLEGSFLSEIEQWKKKFK